MMTTLKMLDKQNLDLYATASGMKRVPVDIRVGYQGLMFHAFGGAMSLADIDADGDMVTITARDAAAPMLDCKIPMSITNPSSASGIANIVTQIASQFGINNVTIAGVPAGATIGSISGKDEIFSVLHRRPWDILWIIARSLGWEVTISPERALYMGPPQGGTISRTLTYKASPGTQGITPVRHLRYSLSPERNQDFSVVVYSTLPDTQQQYVATQNTNSNTVAGQTINTPNLAADLANLVAGAPSPGQPVVAQSSNPYTANAWQGKPAYLFHIEGKTPDQCNQLAQAIAKEIAQKAVIVTGIVDGDVTMAAHQNVQIQWADGTPYKTFGTLASLGLIITKVRHTFQLPGGLSGPSEDGFNTEFTATTIPEDILDNATEVIAGQ